MCRRLAKACADLEVWEPIADFALQGALKSHRKLTIEQDEDWVNLSLAYLRVCALLENSKSENQTGELTMVLDELSRATIEVAANNHPAFAIRILDNCASQSEQAGLSELRVLIGNNLPTSVKITSVCVDLESIDGEQISYSSSSLELAPGETVTTLFCLISVQGLFFLRGTRIYLNAIELYHPADRGDSSVKVTCDNAGPRLRLGLPNEIALDKDQKVAIDVVSGSWAMRDVLLRLESPTHETSFMIGDTTCDQRSVTTGADGINLGDMDVGTSLSVAIPITTDGQHDLTTVSSRGRRMRTR